MRGVVPSNMARTVPRLRLAHAAVWVAISLGIFLACDRDVPAPRLPTDAEVVAIRVLGQRTITDRRTIADILTLCQRSLYGWHVPPDTFPTPKSSAAFLGSKEKALYVLWFGSGWVGARGIAGTETALARVSESDLKRLRGLLGV
jgi:hypothetical protein